MRQRVNHQSLYLLACIAFSSSISHVNMHGRCGKPTIAAERQVGKVGLGRLEYSSRHLFRSDWGKKSSNNKRLAFGDGRGFRNFKRRKRPHTTFEGCDPFHCSLDFILGFSLPDRPQVDSLFILRTSLSCPPNSPTPLSRVSLKSVSFTATLFDQGYQLGNGKILPCRPL